MITIVVNGKERQLEGPVSLSALVAGILGTENRGGIAVSINRRVVRRAEWGSHEIGDGDEIEIIAPFAGG